MQPEVTGTRENRADRKYSHHDRQPEQPSHTPDYVAAPAPLGKQTGDAIFQATHVIRQFFLCHL
ncbi:hypothetical protein [Burkholderia pyrrocinia]